MHALHIRRAILLVRPLGLFSVLLAGISLAGYWLGFESAYRPIQGGPSTHPLTALCIILLGIGLSGWHLRRPSRWPTLLAWPALIISLLRLWEIHSRQALLGVLTPFQGQLAAAAASGQPIAMGANTAAMTTLIAAALLLNHQHRVRTAQTLAFLAGAFPLISLTGYAYGLEKFYGQMALTTVVAGLPLAGGVFLASAHHGILKAVLSPWVGGRIARMQLLLGYLVPFAIGYILLGVAAQNPAELFGLFVVLVSSFISGLIAYTALIQEMVDRNRRAAERRLKQAATHDPLTNLANRRLLLEQASREWERAFRSGSDLAVVLLDIDHFKRLNDTYGHAVGDQVLQELAQLILKSSRSQDLVARIGGEEFVILLPETHLAGALQLAEKLRGQIERQQRCSAHGASITITSSFGCADRRHCASFPEMLARADEALYRAKALGRNRVEAVAEAVEPIFADVAALA